MGQLGSSDSRGRMTAMGRGRAKTPHSLEIGRDPHNFPRLAYFGSLRMLENSVKIGAIDQSFEFSHSLGRELPRRYAGTNVRFDISIARSRPSALVKSFGCRLASESPRGTNPR